MECGLCGDSWRIYGSMILGVMTFLITSMPALAIEYAGTISPDIQSDILLQITAWGGHIYLSRQGLKIGRGRVGKEC